MAKKKLDDCRTWKDFRCYGKKAARRYEDIDYGHANKHDFIETPEGKGTFSRNCKELSPGFRKQIIKMMLGLGVPATLAVLLFIEMYVTP